MFDTVTVRLTVELKDSQLLSKGHLMSTEQTSECVHSGVRDAEAKHRTVHFNYSEVSTIQANFANRTRRAVEGGENVCFVSDLGEFVVELFIHIGEIDS